MFYLEGEGGPLVLVLGHVVLGPVVVVVGAVQSLQHVVGAGHGAALVLHFLIRNEAVRHLWQLFIFSQQ